jgi:hypothetical protein
MAAGAARGKGGEVVGAKPGVAGGGKDGWRRMDGSTTGPERFARQLSRIVV